MANQNPQGLKQVAAQLTQQDREEISRLVQQLVSDASFRNQFAEDPDTALTGASAQLSPHAREILVNSRQQAAALTEQMDNVEGSVFYALLIIVAA